MKRIKINLLAIIGMMVAVATVAFTTIEKSAAPLDGWYEVEITNINDAENPDYQKIMSKIADPPERDVEACAEKGNSGHRCAVELLFDAAATEVPETVKKAEEMPLVSVEADARHPE